MEKLQYTSDLQTSDVSDNEFLDKKNTRKRKIPKRFAESSDEETPTSQFNKPKISSNLKGKPLKDFIMKSQFGIKHCSSLIMVFSDKISKSVQIYSPSCSSKIVLGTTSKLSTQSTNDFEENLNTLPIVDAGMLFLNYMLFGWQFT